MSAEIKSQLLSETLPGKRVEIVGFTLSEVPLKYFEMGFLPGNVVFVKRVAPLKDPIHIEISGYDLAIRLNEASLVLVKDLDSKNGQTP